MTHWKSGPVSIRKKISTPFFKPKKKKEEEKLLITTWHKILHYYAHHFILVVKVQTIWIKINLHRSKWTLSKVFMGPTPIKNIENYKAMIGEGSHETRNFNLHLTIAPTTQKKNPCSHWHHSQLSHILKMIYMAWKWISAGRLEKRTFFKRKK